MADGAKREIPWFWIIVGVFFGLPCLFSCLGFGLLMRYRSQRVAEERAHGLALVGQIEAQKAKTGSYPEQFEDPEYLKPPPDTAWPHYRYELQPDGGYRLSFYEPGILGPGDDEDIWDRD